MGSSKINVIYYLPLLALISVVLLGLFSQSATIEIAKTGVLTLCLTSAVVFYIRIHGRDILSKRLSQWVITASYLLSICLAILPFQTGTVNYWMIGGLIVAMLVDKRLGLFLHFNLVFILGFDFPLQPEVVIYLLIMGMIINLMSSYIRKKDTIVFASVIVLSLNITLAFVMNNFIFNLETTHDYLKSFFSIFLVLILGYFISLLYEKYFQMMDPAMEEFFKQNEILFGENKEEVHLAVTEEPVHVMELYEEEGTSYDLLVDTNNELLLKMKEFSESLYHHSVLIGNLSCQAAQILGADELLAKAGGLYHEVGKINGKDYMEEGLKIASEYGFPKELKVVLRQHNIKYEKPTSIEATNGDNKYTTNKIIDNIFQTRMDKGTFDDSGLSLKDFKKLKEFYQKEFAVKQMM